MRVPSGPLPDRPDRVPLPTTADGLPALPPEYDAVLDVGLAALGISLTGEQRASIATHLRLLVAWNEHINLTAIHEPAALARGHILDSLAAVPVLAGRAVRRLADMGSGGGFPGLPLAVALPALDVTLIESTRKKARFLAVAAAAAGVMDRVHVLAERAEALRLGAAPGIPADVVTARAVAPLAQLAPIAADLLVPGGALLAWKRGDVAREVAAARGALDAAGFGRPQLVPINVPGLDDHRLVVVELEPSRRRGRRPRATLRPMTPRARS